MGVMEKNKEKNSAKEQIVKSVRDLLSLKITLPLGNENLKLVHTNQFLFTELPTEYFELANMEALATALNSSYSRYSGYQVNRWYIEGVTINNDNGKATMDLDLNPFASDVLNYRDAKNDYTQSFVDTFLNNTTSSSSSKTAVKSTTVKNNLAGGEGKYIDNLVKQVVGKETDDLKKAKKIHNYLMGYLQYKGYKNSRHSTAEACHKAKYLNCADTSRLTASMFRSAGIKCYVVHSTCHYYTVMEYNGKLYCSDATSKQRKFNTYWKASSCGNGSTAKFKGKSSFHQKCGKNPCS